MALKCLKNIQLSALISSALMLISDLAISQQQSELCLNCTGIEKTNPIDSNTVLSNEGLKVLNYSKIQGNFDSCNRDEMHTLITDQERAILFINEWLNNYLTQNIIEKLDSITLGAYGNFKTAVRTLKCAKSVIEKGLTYQCNTDTKNAWAKTYPIFGKVVALNSTFFYEDGNHRAGMIIHEATHKCGTTDLGVFNNKFTPPKSNYLMNWPKIADSYEYWAEFGFCYPEIDCEK